MLHRRVVDEHRRELLLSCPVHRDEPYDAGRRLLAQAVNSADQLGEARVHHVVEIAAVVDDDIRADLKAGGQMALVFLLRRRVPGKDIDAPLDERGRDIILRRQDIASGRIDLGPARLEHACEIARLRLQMYGHRHLKALKRLRLLKIPADALQHRHVVLDPPDLPLPCGRKADIPDFTHTLFPLSLKL